MKYSQLFPFLHKVTDGLLTHLISSCPATLPSIGTDHHPETTTPTAEMRSGWAPLVLAALASLAEACGGHHKHEDRVWTAEEIAELEYKWGMEVSELERNFSSFTHFCNHTRQGQACGHDLAGPCLVSLLRPPERYHLPSLPGDRSLVLTADVIAVGCRRVAYERSLTGGHDILI
jgi:hypothetical protein